MVQPGADYLRSLKAQGLHIDVFCGYRSNHGGAGFELASDALQIFTALDLPFGISIIIDEYVRDQLSS